MMSTRRQTLAGLAATAAFPLFAADKNTAMPDLILVNAKVTTVDHENLEAQVIDAGSRTCASCD